MEEEELYLRARAYHTVSKQIDDALQGAIEASVEKVTTGLFAWFRKSRPDSLHEPVTVPALPPCSTVPVQSDPNANNKNHNNNNPFVTEPPTHYRPTMLPLVVLVSPPNLLDQTYLSNSLVANLKKSRTRFAVCHLSRPKVNTKHFGPLIQDIVEQCLAQDDFLLKSNRNLISQVDRLRQWATHTYLFDELLIIVQGTEGLSSRLLQDFIYCLESLRQEGLALHLVLVSSSRLPLYEGNLLVHTLSFPSSNDIVQEFWQRLPTTLSPAILSCIQSSFQNHHASFMKALVLLKQAVALQFSQPEALVGAPSLDDDAARRLAWFYLTDDGRKTILKHAEATSREVLLAKFEECNELQQTVHSGMQAIRHLSPSVVDVVQSLQHAQLEKSMAIQLTEGLRKLSNTDLLHKLGAIRSSLMEQRVETSNIRKLLGLSGSVTKSSALKTVINSTNEVIILVACFINENAETLVHSERFQDDLWQVVHAWVCDILLMLNAARQAMEKMQTIPDVIDCLMPQHRRQIAAAVVNPLVTDRILQVPSILFHLIADRVAIPQQDWFQLYKEWTKQGDNDDENWLLFSLGIYQLTYVGLIREKRGGSRALTVYEKAALVWSTGV